MENYIIKSLMPLKNILLRSRLWIVTTLCDKEEISSKIIDTLLEKRLVSGCQITKVHSKYWWNNKLEECDEYKLKFRTKESKFSEIKNF